MRVEVTTTTSSNLRARAAAELQPVLADLIDLALQGKQAHWNVVGANFTALHAQLDAIVNDTRLWADAVAERMVTLGTPAEGQAGKVTQTSALEPLPAGTLSDRQVLTLMGARLTTVAERATHALKRLGDVDLVSQDLLIGIVGGLEKHLWMLRAQEA